MADDKAHSHYPQSKTGGAAFPKPSCDSMNGEEGMSLRDYFAGQALQGILAGDWVPTGQDSCADQIADAAYKQADSMILARNATE